MKLKGLWTVLAALVLLGAATLLPGSEPTLYAEPAGVQPAVHAYYVAPNGKDSNPGTEARPWRTIAKAARTLTAGDVVYIKDGVYHEHIVPEHSGTAARPIVYTAYPRHQPIIDGTGVSDGYRGLFEVGRLDHISISGLTIRDSSSAAIHVRASDHINIADNRTETSFSSGIGVWRSSNIVLDRNTVVNAVHSPNGPEECITIASVVNFQVSNNHVYCLDEKGCYAAGINVKQASSEGLVYGNVVHDIPKNGIYIDAWDTENHDHQVFGNYIYNVGTGISLGAESGGEARDIDIYNNLIYHVTYSGIRMAGVKNDGLRTDINIYHNTIVESYAHGGAGILIQTYNAQNIVLKNNLINFGPDTFSGQIKAYEPEEIVSVANLVYGPREQTQDPNLVEITAGTIVAEPRFIDRQHQNFRLRRDSPAIDRGAAIDLSFDFDGIPRPQGAGHDIGAFELVKSGPMNHAIFMPLILR